MKKIKLEKHKKINNDSEIKKLETPEYIYIKVKDGYELLVEIDDKVLISTILATSLKDVSLVSSVSGKVIEINDYIKIENDFKEKIEKIDLCEINKENFISLLKDSGITGMGGAGFPVYKKYITNSIETLIVNAVECEPYITADYMICKEHSKEIVQTIEKIMEINNIKETFIAVKKNNHNIGSYFKEYLNEKIKLIEVDDFYPAGWERSLIKSIKKVNYDKIPIEKNIVVNNVSTIYAISRLFEGFRLNERVVTIALNDSFNENYFVKIGTDIKYILDELKIQNKTVILGGPMMGKEYTNQIIDGSINSILLLDIFEEKEKPCLRCGKCTMVCPRQLDPVLIKDYVNNIERLKDLRALDCIECGLCSYICPSKIKVRDKVIEAKNSLKRC